MKKIEIDREILEEYAKQGMSQASIALELGVTQGTVSLKMRQYGIKTKGGYKKANIMQRK